MPEPDLTATLKLAKDKKMFYAFVVKGSDGKLLVSRAKIPPKQIEEAKKEVGSNTVVRGRCTGPLSDLIFEVAKEVSPTLAATVKKVIKRDANLVVAPTFQVSSDAEAEPEEGEQPEVAQTPPTPPPTPPTTKPTAAGGIETVKKFLALKVPFEQALARKGPDTQKLQTLHDHIKGLLDRRQFGEAATALPELEALIAGAQSTGPGSEGRGQAVVGWQTARVEATNMLRKLETMVAKTKHPLAGETVTLLEGLIKRLAGEIKTKQQALDLAGYLQSDDDINDLESIPVEGTTFSIRPALLKALQALQDQLPA